MNLQVLPKILSDAYAMFDSLQLSVTSLVLIGILLTVVFLFAIRQAATWFFKIDDIKSDVRKLRQLVVDLEGEVRLLQGLLTQNVRLASDRAAVDFEIAKPVPLTRPTLQKEKAPEQAPTIKFPVTH